MNTFTRIKKGLLFILAVIICVSSSFLMVNAESFVDNKGESHEIQGQYSNADATYVVSNTVEQKTLEFGLTYRYDKGFVNTTTASDITADMNAAGGSAYASSGKMKDNTYYPADVRVFEIGSDLDVQIVPWTKFKNSNWSLNTVTAMASDYESSHPGYKVIAAINGDFFDINSTSNYNYTSTGSTIAEGNNYKVVENWNHIGFKDGTLKGNLRDTINEKQTIEVFDANGNVLYSGQCDNLNAEPGENETSLFVAFWDDSHKAISFDVSDAYVINASKLAPYTTTSVYGYGTVSKDTQATLGKKNFAIKTNVEALKNVLTEGATVRVQNTFNGELAEYDYVIGYPTNVLLNSECVASADYRHPRTTIGVKADGSIVMAEIDGRQSNINCYGCTLKEEAALMAYYGCVDAFNLDGGGSSTICILEDGKLTIQNSTSDGSARSDGNCLLIVAKVPVLELTESDVTETSFSISLNVTEMIDEYKDLYLYCDADSEYKKIASGEKITYSKLTNNTKYTYTLCYKSGDTYVKLPFAGAINTAKQSLTIYDIEINLSEDGKYYEVTYMIDDPQNTLITVSLVVNNKKHYVNDEKFKIEVDTGVPLGSEAYFVIKNNKNDLKGDVTDKYPVAAKVNNPTVVMSSCINDINNIIGNLYE